MTCDHRPAIPDHRPDDDTEAFERLRGGRSTTRRNVAPERRNALPNSSFLCKRSSLARAQEVAPRSHQEIASLASKEHVSLARTSNGSVAPERWNVQSSDNNTRDAQHRPNVYVTDLRDKSVAPERRNALPNSTFTRAVSPQIPTPAEVRLKQRRVDTVPTAHINPKQPCWRQAQYISNMSITIVSFWVRTPKRGTTL